MKKDKGDHRGIFFSLDNQLWESREYFQSQCRKLEHDVNQLRSVNANLEKTAGTR